MQIKDTSLKNTLVQIDHSPSCFGKNTFNDIFIDIVVNGLVVFGRGLATLHCNFIQC